MSRSMLQLPECNVVAVRGAYHSCILKNEASMADPASPDYLGRIVSALFNCFHLRTQRAVDAHCRALYEKLCRAVDLREDE